MAYYIGFEAGLGLSFGLNMGKCVHTPIGVRVTLCPCEAVYLDIAVYPHKAVYGRRTLYPCKPLYLNKALYDTV